VAGVDKERSDGNHRSVAAGVRVTATPNSKRSAVKKHILPPQAAASQANEMSDFTSVMER